MNKEAANFLLEKKNVFSPNLWDSFKGWQLRTQLDTYFLIDLPLAILTFLLMAKKYGTGFLPLG